jgi:hypothetical protein
LSAKGSLASGAVRTYHEVVMLRGRLIPALVVLGVVLVSLGCTQDMFDTENDLVVLNDSPCDIVVYVDGRQAFDLKAGSDRTLDDIGTGRHVLEALDGSGTLVERRSVELAGGEDYYWILGTCPHSQPPARGR